MKVTILNSDTSGYGISRTIKRQYQQTSPANLLRTGTFGATGVMVEYEEEREIGSDDRQRVETERNRVS